MVHLFHPTFPNSVYEMQTKWGVKCGATVRFPDISSRFAKCCTYLYPHFDMVHLFHPTFPNGGYELQMKWEVNFGAPFRFPDISSRFAKCCTYLDPHFNMVHFFHPTFANGGSYMFNLNTSINLILRVTNLDFCMIFAKHDKSNASFGRYTKRAPWNCHLVIFSGIRRRKLGIFFKKSAINNFSTSMNWWKLPYIS